MSIFLTVFVLTPSVLGVATRWLLGDGSVAKALPSLKLLNSFILLLLNYINASSSLPGIVARPDWGFLALATSAALGMCVLAFAVGWALATLLRADDGRRTALMFGLGMNNNGMGLVLASVALAHLPGVMLPAILYTLVQHVVAGVVTVLNRRLAAAQRPDLARAPTLAGALRHLPARPAMVATSPSRLASEGVAR
jgi:BASS family bile acid:Na+ symporter